MNFPSDEGVGEDCQTLRPNSSVMRACNGPVSYTHLFMNKLDAAITEQRQAVIFAQKIKIAGGDEFLSSQQKLKS